MAAPRRLFGGTQFGIVVLVAAVIGAAASLALLLAELAYLKDPLAAPSCDLNSLIGCGVSLLSPQAHLLAGIPNAAVGLVAFALLAGFALLHLSGVAMPRWVWAVLALGSLAGIAFVGWFGYQSIAVFEALCPYCMVIWVATIVAAVFLIARALGDGHVPGRALGAHLWSYRWLYAAGLLAALALFVVVGMREQIAAVI